MTDVNTYALGLSVVTELLRQAAAMSALLQRAHSENRKPTVQELEEAMKPDDTARVALVDAIQRAKLEGR